MLTFTYLLLCTIGVKFSPHLERDLKPLGAPLGVLIRAFILTGTPFQAHASAAKAAVDALSRVIALEEGPYGVRSNVIAPGLIADTEGLCPYLTLITHNNLKFAFITGASRLIVQSSNPGNEQVQSYHKGTPLQRVGDVDDVANATVFLFSEAANFITAQILVVDGAAENVFRPPLPYPESLLNPKSVESLLKAKM